MNQLQREPCKLAQGVQNKSSKIRTQNHTTQNRRNTQEEHDKPQPEPTPKTEPQEKEKCKGKDTESPHDRDLSTGDIRLSSANITLLLPNNPTRSEQHKHTEK